MAWLVRCDKGQLARPREHGMYISRADIEELLIIRLVDFLALASLLK